MENVCIEIRHDRSKYGDYVVTRSRLDSETSSSRTRKSRYYVKLSFDGIFLHYLIKELALSRTYRTAFIGNFFSYCPQTVNRTRFRLIPAKREIIDYEWNEYLTGSVRERCELEYAFSWLSTLGGAFSALGDYFERCATIAGSISFNQLKLAKRLNDPNMMARCELYLSLSLIQRKRFRAAQRIIYERYHRTKGDPNADQRLLKMCKGIWSKLQYEYHIHKNKSW